MCRVRHTIQRYQIQFRPDKFQLKFPSNPSNFDVISNTAFIEKELEISELFSRNLSVESKIKLDQIGTIVWIQSTSDIGVRVPTSIITELNWYRYIDQHPMHRSLYCERNSILHICLLFVAPLEEHATDKYVEYGLFLLVVYHTLNFVRNHTHFDCSLLVCSCRRTPNILPSKLARKGRAVPGLCSASVNTLIYGN